MSYESKHLKTMLQLYKSARLALGIANYWAAREPENTHWRKSQGFWLTTCRNLKRELRQTAERLHTELYGEKA